MKALLSACCLVFFSGLAAVHITPEMQKIMDQPKYAHATWGFYVKDLETGDILMDVNGDKFFSPASTTKLFSVSALLHILGDDFRFKTPVYATGPIENGTLNGNLVLVAQGDLTLGGRTEGNDKVSFTKMDHLIANNIPGTILTKENPLNGLIDLAKQIKEKGIGVVNGDVIIDDSLFETVRKRDMTLSPIIINDNVIDLVLNPTTLGQPASLNWRPQIAGYTVENKVKTGSKTEITVEADESGQKIIVKGTIGEDQKDLVRTSSIENPKAFARLAFIQVLKENGVKVNAPSAPSSTEITLSSFKDPKQVALYTSPPVTEYAKLILKVSHNLGADLIPLVLAAQAGKQSFDDGMRIIGDFIKNEIKLSPESFVLADAAGGNDNRLTLKGEIQLLATQKNLPADQFKHFYDALPILGVDGSLEDFGRGSPAAGRIRAKPGTGMSMNTAGSNFLLVTQAFAGYIEGKNSHLYAYIVIVNNGILNSPEEALQVFEDEAELSTLIYQKISLEALEKPFKFVIKRA